MIVRYAVRRAMSGLAVVTLAATSLVATASPASAASPFLQVSPTSGVTTVVGSATFTGGPILFDNTAVLPVTFTPTSSTPAGVNVDASGRTGRGRECHR